MQRQLLSVENTNKMMLKYIGFFSSLVGFFIYLVGYASAIVINIPYVYAHFCVQSQSNTTSDLQLSVSFDDPCNSWVLVSLIIM